ncbi:MAG: hypothetical protein ACLR4Z_07360 [Butyricicoccaceae bacterium]
MLAGSLYTGSLLLMRTMVRFDDSAISRIMRVQEDSSEHKAALERGMLPMVSRFIPFMFILAVLLAIVPPLAQLDGPASELGISCTDAPCGKLSGSARCFRSACILVRQQQTGSSVHAKGSEAIEKTAEMRMAVFNKTGT